MHTPPQLRFVSLAHPSWRTYSRSRHPLLSMFLVLAPLTCQLRNGFLRLFMTQRRPRKYRGLALNATRALRTPSCVDVPGMKYTAISPVKVNARKAPNWRAPAISRGTKVEDHPAAQINLGEQDRRILKHGD